MDNQKRIVEINHALSGIYGSEMKTCSFRITQSRKEILKRLDRKKKLSSIIHDELYNYLDKFPQEKMGLNQEFVKKKKARLAQYEEKNVYKTPAIVHKPANFLTKGAENQLQESSKYFSSKMSDEYESST